MERIRVFTESDEYTTLRNESITLFAHARQLLYWTTGFVVAGIGWYTIHEAARNISLGLFTFFLFSVLLVSATAYVVNANQVYRLGGFLAIFWESYEPEARRIWHRFNRQGPAGAFLPDVTIIYVANAVIISVFFIAAVVTGQMRQWNPVSSIIIMGLAEIWLFSQLGWYLILERDWYEAEWRAIKESPERIREIHSHYETVPSMIIRP